MAITKEIICKFALVGLNLELKKNVLISIDDDGKISNIEPDQPFRLLDTNDRFSHHLILPKFINSHVHIGDSVLKDQAYGSSLKEAVGIGGIKYDMLKLSRKHRILAMRSALLEMIQYGISVCYDFREGGLDGIAEIKEASFNLPIDIHILGRPDKKNSLSDIASQCDGLGLSTPLDYSLEELIEMKTEISDLNTIVVTHIAENAEVIEESFNQLGSTDLYVALKYWDPKILIHLTSLKEKDLLKIPRSKYIVFCTRSNAYFGSGFPNVEYFLKNQFLIGLGTDNIMVIPPNVLNELRWLILKLSEQNYHINPINALKMITSNPSTALGLETGCIKNGYWADLLAVDLNSNSAKFGIDPIMTLLFRSQIPNDVCLNMYHGEEISNDY